MVIWVSLHFFRSPFSRPIYNENALRERIKGFFFSFLIYATRCERLILWPTFGWQPPPCPATRNNPPSPRSESARHLESKKSPLEGGRRRVLWSKRERERERVSVRPPELIFPELRHDGIVEIIRHCAVYTRVQPVHTSQSVLFFVLCTTTCEKKKITKPKALAFLLHTRTTQRYDCTLWVMDVNIVW